MPKNKEFDEESEDDFLNEDETLDDSYILEEEEEITDVSEEPALNVEDDDEIDIVIEVTEDEDFSNEESVDELSLIHI